jgi:hypothetical protein
MVVCRKSPYLGASLSPLKTGGMDLKSLHFEHEGADYLASLRFLERPRYGSSTQSPRWVVYRATREWTLPGSGHLDETPDEVRERFLDHLRSRDSSKRR